MRAGCSSTPASRTARLRADHWLHWKGEVRWDEAGTRRFKAAIRRQFHPDTPDWKEMVIWRSRQVQRQTLEGLARLQ